jgi:sec-independent protein translocase protein TatC
LALDQLPEHVEEKQMSFIDHLEELRWHLIRSVISILVFTIAAFFNKSFIFGTLILGPSKPSFWTYRSLCRLGAYMGTPGLCIDKIPFTMQSREMSGQFSMHVTSSFVIGLICAFPYAFWEIWRFIRPALYTKEQKTSRGAVFWVAVLFLTGVLFGYYIVAPMSINFLASYTLDPSIVNEFDIQSYISVLTTLTISCGLMFQLPIVVFFLTKIGLLSPEVMRLYRRHAVVIILIIAAILTPSPDILSQMLVGIPMYLLYEGSIYVSAAVKRSTLKRLNKAAA